MLSLETTQQLWQKRGRLFCPDVGSGWIHSHAQVPTPHLRPDGRLRIYFGARDRQNRTSTVFVEVDPQQLSRVVALHDKPILPLGALGCFDDAGVMPSCLVEADGTTYLYYTGWNTSTTVPYRNAIGVAASRDGGQSFERVFDGPILDRHAEEPHFCATPFVLRDGGLWRMWYLSCTGWTMVAGKPEACYLIRYTESNDGLTWQRPGRIAIDYERPDEAIARPWVLRDHRGYHMWYSYRSIDGYRTRPDRSYRIGYAASSDGYSWKREDDAVNLPASSDAWDAEMTAYAAVIDLRGRRYMLYNGNGFGASGFGFAELAPC
jgi:hypothetical protein